MNMIRVLSIEIKMCQRNLNEDLYHLSIFIYICVCVSLMLTYLIFVWMTVCESYGMLCYVFFIL